MGAVFGGIGRGGALPPALGFGRVPLLPKAGDSAAQGGPTTQRPVTILSLYYRVYPSIRYKQLLPWQELWINDGLR